MTTAGNIDQTKYQEKESQERLNLQNKEKWPAIPRTQPPKRPNQLVLIKIRDMSEELVATRMDMRGRAVVGRVIGLAPIHKDVAEYVSVVCKAIPEEIKMKSDNSFMITFSTIADALELLLSKDLVQIEPWTPQADLERTKFTKKFMWVQLSGLRDECVRMVDKIVSAVGELHIKPDKSEFLVKHAKPRFGVKMNEMMALPKDVTLQFVEDGVEKEIVQIIDYPDLPIRCRVCGSLEHLQEACPEPLPWKEITLGRVAEPKGFLPCFGGDNLKRRLTPPVVTRNKHITRQLFGKGITADLAVLRVGTIVWREGLKGVTVWVPTQERR